MTLSRGLCLSIPYFFKLHLLRFTFVGWPFFSRPRSSRSISFLLPFFSRFRVFFDVRLFTRFRNFLSNVSLDLSKSIHSATSSEKKSWKKKHVEKDFLVLTETAMTMRPTYFSFLHPPSPSAFFFFYPLNHHDVYFFPFRISFLSMSRAHKYLLMNHCGALMDLHQFLLSIFPLAAPHLPLVSSSRSKARASRHPSPSSSRSEG